MLCQECMANRAARPCLRSRPTPGYVHGDPRARLQSISTGKLAKHIQDLKLAEGFAGSFTSGMLNERHFLERLGPACCALFVFSVVCRVKVFEYSWTWLAPITKPAFLWELS